MAYRSNLSAEQVLELLEEESSKHDWLNTDEESSSESDSETGFHAGDNSMDPLDIEG